MTEETVKTICEMKGLRFVNKTPGLTTTCCISLDTLTKIVNEAIQVKVEEAIAQNLNKP